MTRNARSTLFLLGLASALALLPLLWSDETLGSFTGQIVTRLIPDPPAVNITSPTSRVETVTVWETKLGRYTWQRWDGTWQTDEVILERRVAHESRKNFRLHQQWIDTDQPAPPLPPPLPPLPTNKTSPPP